MAGLVLVGFTLGTRAAPAEEIRVETLTPRPGVTLSVLVLRADRPAASVVLFPGGDGKVGGFQPNGTPDGIVLTSSIVEPSFQGGLPSQRLGEIRIPTLLVHHEKDECKHTLFKDVPPVLAAITRAPRKELITFRDGGPPRGDPCDPWGYHGYPGIESRVVIRIADWIKAPR